MFRAILAFLYFASVAHTQTAEEILKDAGLSTGLCVRLGTTDGRLEADLARDGKFLVQGFATDAAFVPKVRASLREQGVIGLANVDHVASLKRLPFPDNFVNLLVADLDQLADQAPTKEEIERVVTPFGVSYLKQAGRWTKTVKPLPKGMDDWTHWDHDVTGNPVSSDRSIKPTTSLRWQAGPLRGMHDAVAGMRLADGKVFFSAEDENSPRGSGVEGGRSLHARDAFNGLMQWKRPVQGLRNRFAMVAQEGRIYTMVDDAGFLEALDTRTGQTKVQFKDGTPIPNSKARLNAWRSFVGGLELPLTASHLVIRAHDGKLIQANGQQLETFDAETGKKLWTFGDGDKKYIPWFVAGDDKIFALVSNRSQLPWRGSPTFVMDSLVALEAATGKVVWRSNTLAGRGLFRFLYHDGHLVIPTFPIKVEEGSFKVSAQNKYFVTKLKASDGSVVWQNEDQKQASGHYQIAMVKDDRVYVANQNGFALDWKTGKYVDKFSWGQYDVGCADLRGCPDFTFYGLTFVDSDGKRTTRGQARSACDVGVFPGYGLLFMPPGHCLCSNYVNGHLAVAAEKPLPGVPDERRLQPGAVKVAPTKALWPEANDWPIHLGQPDRGAWSKGAIPDKLKIVWEAQVGQRPAGPLPDDWKSNEQIPGILTAPTLALGKVFVAVPDAHRVEALDVGTGKQVWTFTAGARIDSPPTIYHAMCLFGCRDGWVYGLRASDGQLVWRFFAAHADKRIAVQSQLESAWPVHGSVLIHEGAVVCTAGRQSALDEGIQVYWLDPFTGRLLQKSRIWTDPDAVDPFRSGYQPDYRRIQDLLTSDGKMVHHTIDTLPALDKPSKLVTLYPRSASDRGGWLNKDGKKLPWLWANASGFVSRLTDSQGRFDTLPMVYGDLQAHRIVLAPEMLYYYGHGRGKFRGVGLFAHARNADGSVGDEIWLNQKISTKKTILALVGNRDRLWLAPQGVNPTAKSVLQAYSTKDGQRVDEWTLPAPPVRDGVALGQGRIVISLENGKVIALGQ